MTESLGNQEALLFNMRVQKQLMAVSRAIVDVPYELTLQYPNTTDFEDTETLDLLPKAGERNHIIIELIEKLIPSPESLIQTKIPHKVVYPESRIYEIFNREDSKQNVRLIHFLLDSNIAYWWTKIDNNEFEKFLQMAKENHLPASLTSHGEATRIRAEGREFFVATLNSMTIDRDLSMPPFRVIEKNLLKPERNKEPVKEPARRKFLELYSEHKNLDICVEKLSTIYPNEA